MQKRKKKKFCRPVVIDFDRFERVGVVDEGNLSVPGTQQLKLKDEINILSSMVFWYLDRYHCITYISVRVGKQKIHPQKNHLKKHPKKNTLKSAFL